MQIVRSCSGASAVSTQFHYVRRMQRIEGLWDSRLAGAATERPFSASKRTRPQRPNLIFILADDLGWGDLGCFGSLHIHTPNLDRLAAGGVRFTHAYSASPWCSPTRISLYTGRDPGRLPAGLEEPLRTRNDQLGIPHDHPCLPGLLAATGYRTAMVGKWHCGWMPWFSPLKIGFQEFFGNLDGAVDYFTHIGTLGEPDLWEGEEPIDLDGYYTDLIADRAVDYVRRVSTGDDPFYLQVNFTAPHWPWEGRGDRDVADRIKAQFEGSMIPPILHLDGGSLAKYTELVEIMDEGVGRILDVLDELEAADNTLIVFCSDNGGERYSFMWPFKGEKGDLTEGGIRVPCIARWPAALDGGQWSDGYHNTMDWTATFLDAAGASADSALPLDGISLLPWLVDGEAHPQHPLFWRITSQGAMRLGNYKYLYDARNAPVLGNWPRFPFDRHQLFDVSGDGRECADLAGTHTEIIAKLRGVWEAHARELLPYPESAATIRIPAADGAPLVSQPD
jgi:arylsulfatase A-like enzyme